jgi:hypothetical protein
LIMGVWVSQSGILYRMNNIQLYTVGSVTRRCLESWRCHGRCLIGCCPLRCDCLIWQIFTDTSEHRSATIFRKNLLKAIYSTRTAVNTYQITRCHIPLISCSDTGYSLIMERFARPNGRKM